MSIVPLVKVTVYGPLGDKEQVLADLQEMGCLHILPLHSTGEERLDSGPSPKAQETLKFLLSCPQQRRQVHDPTKFDAEAVEHCALELQEQIHRLEDERDFLRRRITDLQPWGDFLFPPLDECNNLHLWFYIVPHQEMKKVEATDLIWEIVGRDHRFAYVVVVSEDEPQGMPVARTHTGSKSLAELEQRLEEVEGELEDVQAERASLTRWCTLFAQALHRLEDKAARVKVAAQTYDDTPLFALQAWAPREHVTPLQTYAQKRHLALDVAEPTPEDKPPTLLRNPPNLAGGQDLVSFYLTPSYWLWDPSTIVFCSFALFFAMILADAGYGLVLGLGLALGWRRMGHSAAGQRLRILFAVLVSATMVWGVLSGSYFGVTPAKGTLLAKFHLFDLFDSKTMMRLSIMIGVAHLVLANVADAWRRGLSPSTLAPIGWVAMLLGALAVGLSKTGVGPATLATAGAWAFGLGGVAVVLFTGGQGTIGARLVHGLLALTRIPSAFGDVLSYLRLFALGLATASLALAFNDLSAQVAAAGPGVRRLFALFILLIGHGLNFTLGLMSGVVHGLRLNFIEFFNWSIAEEGYPFQAFARKETTPWNKP